MYNLSKVLAKYTPEKRTRADSGSANIQILVCSEVLIWYKYTLIL